MVEELHEGATTPTRNTATSQHNQSAAETKPADFPETADVVIIGSGLSGGLIAERLVAAGHDCLMLEAGRRWQSVDFPLPELTQGQLFWKQGMEFTSDGRMIVLRGKCVGGSSVVNQALLDTPPAEAMDRWAGKTRIPWFHGGGMIKTTQDILTSGRFRHTQIPLQANNGNANHFLKGMADQGWETRQLHRAQADCGWDKGGNCMDCLGGCSRKSKQSALETTIPRAEAQGLRVIAQTEVKALRENSDGVTLELIHRGTKRRLKANRVILASGAIGTPAILLRSGMKNDLPALGENFYVHPQFNSFARFKTPVDGHLGAFQSVASADPRLQAQGFKLECIVLPRAVMALTAPWAGRRTGQLGDYRYWAGAEVSIRDTEPGRIQIGRRGATNIIKTLCASDIAKRACARDVISDVFKSAGARDITHGWASLSVHPMGGCAIGMNRKQSVVSPDFRPHGSHRIHVCDASLFPDALGANPSLTVMAFADRAADAVLEMSQPVHV